MRSVRLTLLASLSSLMSRRINLNSFNDLFWRECEMIKDVLLAKTYTLFLVVSSERPERVPINASFILRRLSSRDLHSNIFKSYSSIYCIRIARSRLQPFSFDFNWITHKACTSAWMTHEVECLYIPAAWAALPPSRGRIPAFRDSSHQQQVQLCSTSADTNGQTDRLADWLLHRSTN